MGKLTKRITAMLLAGMLVIGSVPGSVLAASTDVDPGQTSEIAEEVFTEDTLEEPVSGGETSEIEDTFEEPVAAGESYPEEASAEETAAQYYTVILDANGGYFENEWDDAIEDYAQQAEVIEKHIPVDGTVADIPVFTDQDGQAMLFAGWSLERDGELVSQAEEGYVPVDSCVLYAVWQAEDVAIGEIGEQEVADEGTEQADSVQELEEVYAAEELADAVTSEENPVEEDEVTDFTEDTSDVPVGAGETTQVEETSEAPASTADLTEEASAEDEAQYYTVTLDANGGYFENEWDDSIGDYAQQAEVVEKHIPVDGTVAAIPVFTDQEGQAMLFAGWSLERDGELVIAGDEEYAPVDNCVLYAVWNVEVSAVESESSDEDTVGEDTDNQDAESANESTDQTEQSEIDRESENAGTEITEIEPINQQDAESDHETISAEKNEQKETTKEDAAMGVVESGTCGENLTWALDSAGTLTISGTGNMEEYENYDCPPWYYTNSSMIEKIVIEDGVTSIGSFAFNYCSYLSSITIPDSVTSIGRCAFNNCSSLSSIKIPKSVMSIEYMVFADCGSLKTITIPDGVIAIGDWAFCGCRELVSVIIPSSMISIGVGAFSGCDKINNVTIPDGVKSIEESTFRYCHNLTSISIPESVTNIGFSAFEECSSLVKITIPNGVKNIGECAFNCCRCLEEIEIQNGVINIADFAFSSCESLSRITIPKSVNSIGSGAFYCCKSLRSLTVPDSVEIIGNSAFSECSFLESINLSQSLKSIGYDTFRDCKSLNEIYFKGKSPSFEDNVFFNVTATAYYPANDPTWTEDVRQNYGGNITWVEWDPTVNQEKGFNLREDGHCVINVSACFGYDEWTNWFGLFGYKIPLERYQEVFGEKYTKQIYDQNISTWGGNCFGMAATAAMFYLGSLPVVEYTHDVGVLAAGGYDELTSVDGKAFVKLKKSSELTKLIERYQIWQGSIECNNAKRKYSWNHQKDAFSYIVDRVKTTKEPILMGIRWDDPDDGNVGHRVVIDTSREPQDLGNGWYRVFVYDPNNPFFEYFGDSTPIDNYLQAENRFIELNVENGQWRMAATVNGNGTSTTDIGYDLNGNLIPGSSINFMSARDIPSSFDKKATFSADDNTTAISYACNDFLVKNDSGTRMFQMLDGKIVFIDDANVESNYYEGYSEGVSSGVAVGKLLLPKGEYISEIQNGYVSFSSDGDYVGVVTKEHAAVRNATSTELEIESESTEPINVVIENVTGDDFESVKTDIVTGDSSSVLSVEEGQLMINTDTDQAVDVEIITNQEEQTVTDIEVRTNEETSIDLSKNEEDPHVSQITINESSIVIEEGTEITLSTEVVPPDAENKTIKWSSSNTNIATVDNNGTVKGVSEGKATITAAACDGSNVYAECEVTVNKPLIAINNATITGISNKTYTGSALTQNPTVKVGDQTLTKDTDYTVSYTNNTKVGTATVKITGKGNYTGTVSKTFKINGIPVSNAAVTGISNKTYTGSAITQNPTVKVGDKTLTKNTDYTVSYANNTKVGTSTVKIIGKGNYTGTISKTFKISGRSIAKATISGIVNKTYTGSAKTQNPTVKVGDKILKKGTDYTVSYANNINVGTATVTITGKGNYTSKKIATFKINKAAQSITAKAGASRVAVGKTTTVYITGNKGKKSYKSSNTAIATVTSAGKVTAKKVGTVKITATSAATANYKAASKIVTIKVVPAATASLTAANQVKGIKLTWKKVTGANGYKVYRGSTLIKTITSGSTVTFADTKANTNGTKYTYRVVAKAATGDSTLSKSRVIYRVSRPAVSSVKNSASKKMTVKWGKNAKATGYQIQYSTDKTFKTGNKAVSITSASTVSKVIGSLTKGKTYYVRIRTYKTVGSTKYWSIWSAARSVKISK